VRRRPLRQVLRSQAVGEGRQSSCEESVRQQPKHCPDPHMPVPLTTGITMLASTICPPPHLTSSSYTSKQHGARRDVQ
jgi:hypothetical protein